MDVHRDGDVASRRAASAERPIGASAEPRPREEHERPPAPGPKRRSPASDRPSSEPARAMTSEPAKAAGWFMVGVVLVAAALMLLSWFLFPIAIAAPLALVVLGVAAVLIASRSSRLQSGVDEGGKNTRK